MTEPADAPPAAPSTTAATTPGGPVDDRRDDPPAPASAHTGRGTAKDESRREAQETVRSISRLEESN